MKKRTPYYISANFITTIHVVWTFVIFGGAIFLFFDHHYALWEIVVLTFTLCAGIPFGNVCPLTLLEERLRRKYDPSYTNGGSYMTTYINKVFGTQFTVIQVNVAVAVAYVLIYSFAILVLIVG